MIDTQILYDELSSEPAAQQAYHALNAAGGRVYIVGGAVRDTVLGKQPHDIDLMVTGLPAETIEATLKTLPGYATFAGKNFGVFHYHSKGSTVEIAMPRTEQSTGTGHKDFAVNADHTLSAQEDLGRRDFTANAMAFDINSGELVDPYNGLQDLQEGKLRVISPQSFQDDPLRIVRAVVAYSKHGLVPDDYTLQEMTNNAAKIRHLPAERLQQELDKLFSGSDPAGALEIAHQTGVLEYLCPELDNAMGFDQQNVYHDLPVGEHCLQVLRHIATKTQDPDLRLAAVLHDIGKPGSYWQDDEGNGHFYKSDDVPGSEDHANLGANMTQEFMGRMRYPNARIQRVTNLVQKHMFPYYTTENGMRKFINAVGSPENANDLLELREADASGKNSGQISEKDQEALNVMRALHSTVTSEQQPMTIKDLAINGRDLIQLGITPGPAMGQILNSLFEEVLENPSLNNKPALTTIVKEMYDQL